MLNLKEYVKKYDYFKIYKREKNHLTAIVSGSYGYCKHSLLLQKVALKGEEEVLDEMTMSDKLGKKLYNRTILLSLIFSHNRKFY